MAQSIRDTHKKILLSTLCAILVLTAAFSTYQSYHFTQKRARIKEDFSRVNDIRNGLFSVNAWKKEIEKIVENQIQGFKVSPRQDSILRAEINDLLHALVDEAQQQIQQDDDSFGKKVRNLAVKAFVNWENVRATIPDFTERIITEIKDDETKDRLQILANDKLDELSNTIYDNTDSLNAQAIFKKYGVSNEQDFNEYTKAQAQKAEVMGQRYTYLALGVLLCFALSWLGLFRFHEVHKTLFFFSALVGLVILLGGLASPMIEIDARISKMDFNLLGQHVIFEDQLLYYRSKSILEVVQVLMNTGKADSFFVGFLILAFSVLLPIAKLISTQLFTLGNRSWRKNALLNWLAFKSGKWSMADVIVVAIFMAYVGFNGIMENQLKDLNYKTDTVHSVSTNLTSLEPGFYLFLGYVLYGLVLAVILKNVSQTSLNEAPA